MNLNSFNFHISLFNYIMLSLVLVGSSRSRSYVSTDSSMKNWREVQINDQRRQKNLRNKALRLKRLRQLNEECQGLISNQTSKYYSSHLFYHKFEDREAAGVTLREGIKEKRCTFLGADCSMEVQEQEAVAKYITDKDIVLELGGRFGTTSCTIAAYQNNSGNLVVVEPDRDVWYILARNQQSHFCNFWTFRGVVSHFPIQLNPAEYATRTISLTSSSSIKSSSQIPHMDLRSLQRNVNLYFNVLLIDCEGCIEELFGLPPSLNIQPNAINKNVIQDFHAEYLKSALENVTTIIIETDMKENTPHCQQNCVNYQKWFGLFNSFGFEQVHNKVDYVFSFIDHIVFHRLLST